ncbi:isoprenylcysteine carboxylmethyltransferase family protein [bacterium]|nr:isoprenylcysteine carboxylmethyltransferase family protein [bacterium]
MNSTIRLLIGYLLGIGLFYVAIPWGLVGLHALAEPLFPFPLLPLEWLRWALVAVLLSFGLGFAAWSNIALRVVGRGGPAEGFGVAVSPRTQKLVTTGPYRFTRNPMAFGTFLNYFALALALDSAAVLVFVAVLLPAGIFYIGHFEETRLARDFGEEFREYRKRVPMFFPWFPGQ